MCVCTWSGWSGVVPKSLTIIITLHTTVTIVNAMGFLVNGIGYNAVQGGHVCVFGAWIYYDLSGLDQERHALHVSLTLTGLPLTHPYISSAGWITMVNTYWYKYELFIVHFGQGTEFLLIAGQFCRLNIGNQYHNPLAHLETSPKKTKKKNTHAGGAVFINTGYAGGAYIAFAGNPSIVKIWIAGHSVKLGNPPGRGINTTYHGALALRKKGVTYFPTGGKPGGAQAAQHEEWCVMYWWTGWGGGSGKTGPAS